MDDDQARRIFELMVLTAWADGHLHPSESHAADEFLQVTPELSGVKDPDALAGAAKARLDEVGVDAAVEECARAITGQEHRELAFMCCARVLEADRRIEHGEFRVMSRLRRLFGLSSEEVNRLLSAASSRVMHGRGSGAGQA